MTDIGTQNAQARDAWVRIHLATIPRGSRIIDIGAGERPYKKDCEHLDYKSQDLAQYKPDPNKPGLKEGAWDFSKIDIVSDIENIPEPDGSFGAVLCTEVLEHIPDPVSAVKEMGRLLKSGGTLILTAPLNSLVHQEPFYFCSGFSEYWYSHWLPKFGMNVEWIVPNGSFFTMLAQEARRFFEWTPDNPVPRVQLDFLLQALNHYEINNHQLLNTTCHGYHVLARKKAS